MNHVLFPRRHAYLASCQPALHLRAACFWILFCHCVKCVSWSPDDTHAAPRPLLSDRRCQRVHLDHARLQQHVLLLRRTFHTRSRTIAHSRLDRGRGPSAIRPGLQRDHAARAKCKLILGQTLRRRGRVQGHQGIWESVQAARRAGSTVCLFVRAS